MSTALSISIDGDAGSQILNKLVQSYDEAEQGYMLRTALVVYQTKRVSATEEQLDDYWKTKQVKVMRQLTAFETIAHIETAKALSLNPILNHLILLEGQVYITLDGHLQNAHQSGRLKSIKTEKIGSGKATVEVKKWVNGVWSAKGHYDMKDEEVNQYRYKCTIEKKDDKGTLEVYEAEGVADVSNVAGGDKNSALKLEQMAEARAMRRCLKRAFPVGLGSYEDTQDMPDYVIEPLPPVKKDVFDEAPPTPNPDTPPEQPAPPAPKKAEKKELTFNAQLIDLLEKRGFIDNDSINQYFTALGLDTTIEEIQDEDTSRDLLLTITPL